MPDLLTPVIRRLIRRQPAGQGPEPKRTGLQRAVIHTEYGEPDVLTWSETHPVLAPHPGQVQIRVHAAAVNPIDWQTMEGNRDLMEPRSFPFVPLFDLAGVVTAVGAGVDGFAVGDAVHTDNHRNGGGASEYVTVDADLVAHKPASLTFAEAAAVPLAAQTALLCLDRGGVGPGSRVIVIGASGGVGGYAVQMAKARGASTVIGVTSAKNASYVRSLGADQIIDYTTTTLAEGLGGHDVDVVVDCVGGRDRWMSSRPLLAPGGRFVTIARDEDGMMTGRSIVKLATAVAWRLLRGHTGRKIQYIPVFLQANAALLERVDAMIDAGQVRVHLGAVHPFTLDGVREALRQSKRGRMTGKAVVEIVTG